ncbi:hypothetical protein [Photobacterium leiognathi]|uniref:hypothetical protein n=1 Tax=Photobacterium leiognathi TaxID=553611 RepID=UPI00298168D0|nr:hypothetical protein [Photobacterium leiognathi]
MKFDSYLSRPAFSHQQAALIIDRQPYKYQLPTRLVAVCGLRPVELYSLKKVDGQFYVVGKNEIERRINVPVCIARELAYVERKEPVVVPSGGKSFISYYDIPGGVVLDHTVIEISKVLFNKSMNCGGLRHLYAINRWNNWYKQCGDRELAFSLIQFELGDNYDRSNDIIKQFKSKTLTDFEIPFANQIFSCAMDAAIVGDTTRTSCFSVCNLLATAKKYGVTLKLENIIMDQSPILCQFKEAQRLYDFSLYQYRLTVESIYSKRVDIALAKESLTCAEQQLHQFCSKVFK